MIYVSDLSNNLDFSMTINELTTKDFYSLPMSVGITRNSSPEQYVGKEKKKRIGSAFLAAEVTR